ncbi:M48 family metallopeptidase [Mangrovicella endophytica]|uniref:M48 family metallopeptidase n=1 Tax=Mangrovicella endophytica TaxID=2066697 RepID=UPI000C9E4128|nr:M48 family metallopeptidase [Mangrovicella endophytica]
MASVLQQLTERSPSFASRIALTGWIVVLPICLIALGLWQIDRGAQTLETYRNAQADLPPMLAEVKKIADEDPFATINFQGEGAPALAAMLAVAEIEKSVAYVDQAALVSELRWPLGFGTVGGAVLALVGGLLGLLAAAIAGLRARRSREQMVRSFARLRAILPFSLSAVILGLAVCAISATLFEVGGLWFQDSVSGGEVKLALAGLLLAATALYGAILAIKGLRQVFALYTPEPIDVEGRAVTEAEAPEFWRAVRELAERQGALMPEAVVIGLTEGFFVTEAPVRIWPEQRVLSGRTLYMPAPYLGLLSAPEVTAILGHELAHFAGEDTAYSTRFAPIHAGLWRAIGALQNGEAAGLMLRPAATLGFQALKTFDNSVGHWSRLREFEADRLGSMVSGPEGAASALLRSAAVSAVIDRVLMRAYQAPGAAPPDLIAAICAEAGREGVPDPAEHLEERQPHPTDSHPPTRQRIAALSVTVDETLLRRASRVPDANDAALPGLLFRKWPQLCATLSADFLDRARHVGAARQAQLEADAALMPEGETAIYDNGKPMIWTMGILAVLMGGFAVASIAFAAGLGIAHDPSATTIILCVTSLIALLAAGYAWYVHRSMQTPVLVLTPTHLKSRVLTEPIAWTSISDFKVYASNRFALQLLLKEGTAIPAKSRVALYSKIQRKKRLVTLGFLGVKGMKPDAFAELVDRHLRAAYARASLQTAA